MNRTETAAKTMKDLYGEAHTDLSVSDPEFAAIKQRLIFGEGYAEEKLPAKLRELVILVVAAANQTMNEVKRHTAAALAVGVKPEEIREAARWLAGEEDVFFLGRNLDYALSLEGSLKLKEISYIHSEAYPAGELKHGTLSLISDGVPVIASASLPSLYGKTKASLSEVKARGALTILVTAEDTAAEGDADFIIQIHSESEALTAIAAVTVYQLLAYHTAVLRGTDVDMPKNLAKSVTVE